MENFKGVFIPKEILDLHALTLTERILLAEIHHLSAIGPCFASNAYLGKILGLSTQQISAYISRLRKHGHIQWEPDIAQRTGRVMYSNIARQDIPQNAQPPAVETGTGLPENQVDDIPF